MFNVIVRERAVIWRPPDKRRDIGAHYFLKNFGDVNHGHAFRRHCYRCRPGGYIAAIRAAQLGMKVACVDAWKNKDGKPAPGGTCNNIGCIPSKALLQSSENFEQAKHHFGTHGISTGDLRMDVTTMLERKNQVVKSSNEGILYLFRKTRSSSSTAWRLSPGLSMVASR